MWTSSEYSGRAGKQRWRLRFASSGETMETYVSEKHLDEGHEMIQRHASSTHLIKPHEELPLEGRGEYAER